MPRTPGFILEAKLAANQWQAVDRVYAEVPQSIYDDESSAHAAKARIKHRLNCGAISSARKRPIRVRKVSRS